MKYTFKFSLLAVFLLLSNCKTVKYSKFEPTVIDVNDITKVSESDNALDIKSAFIGMKQPLVVSPIVDYSNDDDVKKMEIELLGRLGNITRFKSLKELYLFNFHLSKIPESVSELKDLETLQINFYRHLNIDLEIEHLKKMPKLKFLFIHMEMLSKEQIQRFKVNLPKIKVVDIDKM